MDLDNAFLDGFPQDYRLWRIHWFGEIKLNPQIPTEPTVDVILCPSRHYMPPSSITIKEALDFDDKKQCIVPIGIGTLPYLTIGSLWWNGRRVKGSNENLYQRYRPKNIIFSRKTLNRMDACALEDDGEQDHYIIPPYVYRIGHAAHMTQCLAIANEDDAYHIIIPMIEVIRFYYGGSTTMIRHLMSGQFAELADGLFNVKKTGIDTTKQYCIVWLRMRIPDNDSQIISLLATSPYALKGAKRIFDSIIKNKLDPEKRAAVAETWPPFQGEARLSLQGLWIESGGKKRFLVFQINKSNLPGPEHIKCMRDNDGRNYGIHDPERPEAWVSRAKIKIVTKEELDVFRIRQDTEPYKQSEEVFHYTLLLDRFTDKPTIEKLDKDECHYRAAKPVVGLKSDQLLEDYSTGAGAYSGTEAEILRFTTAAKGSYGSARQQAMEASFDNFKNILNCLTTIDNTIAYEIISVMSDTDDYPSKASSPFPIMFEGKKIFWSYIDKTHTQIRQALIAKVRCQQRSFYAIEIEKRPNTESKEHFKSSEHFKLLLLHHIGFNTLSGSILYEVLGHIASNQGRWPMSNTNDLISKFKELKLTVRPFMHTRPKAEDFAKALSRYIVDPYNKNTKKISAAPSRVSKTD